MENGNHCSNVEKRWKKWWKATRRRLSIKRTIIYLSLDLDLGNLIKKRAETVVRNIWSQMVGGLNRLFSERINWHWQISGVSSNWFKNQFCPSIRLSRLRALPDYNVNDIKTECPIWSLGSKRNQNVLMCSRIFLSIMEQNQNFFMCSNFF